MIRASQDVLLVFGGPVGVDHTARPVRHEISERPRAFGIVPGSCGAPRVQVYKGLRARQLAKRAAL